MGNKTTRSPWTKQIIFIEFPLKFRVKPHRDAHDSRRGKATPASAPHLGQQRPEDEAGHGRGDGREADLVCVADTGRSERAGNGRRHICLQVPGFRDKGDDVVLVIIYCMLDCNKRPVSERGGGRGGDLPQATTTSASGRRARIRILTHFTIVSSLK